jgi:hypothetical protein
VSSTRHNLLHQLTRPACRICFINATGEAVLLQQHPGRTGPTLPATASTAPDLHHQRLCPPHWIYSTDDRVHRTGSTSPTPSCASPKMPSRSRRTARPRRPCRSAIGTLARFLAIMFFYCWMLLICWYLAKWISWLRFSFCLRICY